MKVIRVEPAGRADVYNMEVPGPHSFVIENGVVAHNCYDETRYMLMEYKMKAPTPAEERKPAPFDPLADAPQTRHEPRYW